MSGTGARTPPGGHASRAAASRSTSACPRSTRSTSPRAGDADVYGVSGDDLAISASSGSDVTASGRIARLALDASGGGDADLTDLEARDATVEVSGGSDADVRASATLDVKASGGSDVSYRGEPELTRDVSGSSDLTRG